MALAELGKCDWCGIGLESGEGWRLVKPARNMGAAFCRLEHVAPWLTEKNDWHILDQVEVPPSADPFCAVTGNELDEAAMYLIRRHGDVEVVDGFSGPEETLKWARAGGRYAP